MNFRIENRLFTFYIGVNRVEMVNGYNSNVDDNDHFLMWDFDDIPIALVITVLKHVQKDYDLPTIYILPTGRDDCFHANCFKRLTWNRARAIIAVTPFVDKKFLAIGILRGFFTLRYSPTREAQFERAIPLLSKVPADVDPLKLTSFSSYPKKVRGGILRSLFRDIAKKQTVKGGK